MPKVPALTKTKAAPPADLHHASAPAIEFGPLKQRLGYVLRRAQVAIFQDFFLAFSAYKIRPAQYSILTIIEQNPGLSQTQVAEALGIKKTNFVAMITALQQRDLASRRPVVGDRRSHALYLTEAGAALMPVLHKIVDAHEARIVALIGAETHAGLFAPLQRLSDMRPDLSGESEEPDEID